MGNIFSVQVYDPRLNRVQVRHSMYAVNTSTGAAFQRFYVGKARQMAIYDELRSNNTHA
jgi:hypothetical protein